MYLIDANVLIFANNSYYPIDRVPQFWEWIQRMSQENRIKIPREMYDEITEGHDDLCQWISSPNISQDIVFSEKLDRSLYNEVIEIGYGLPLDAPEIEEKVGKDPFLIAYALKGRLIGESRIVVSNEVSKSRKTGANRKVPDVCNDLEIECITDIECYRTLGFRID